MRLRFMLPVFAIATSLPALADEATTVSLGLRAWSNSWTSWDVYPPTAVGGQTIPGASENFTSGNRVVAIPTVSVRHRDFLFSGSHFASTRYAFDGNSGSFSAHRKETDGLVGYYVLPTLALTLGYKEVKQDFGGSAKFKYSGPIVGAVGSAPLTSGFSLYGNFGYGKIKAHLPLTDASGRSKLDADYLLGEVGLAYSIDTRSMMPSAKGLALTLGYRSQVLATQDYRLRLSTTSSTPNRSTQLRDTTEGLTLGVSVSF